MEILQGVLKQHLRPRAVVGYGVKIFLPSPPNYVTRSPGCRQRLKTLLMVAWNMLKCADFDEGGNHSTLRTPLVWLQPTYNDCRGRRPN